MFKRIRFLALILLLVLATACTGKDAQDTDKTYPYTESIEVDGNTGQITWLNDIPQGYLVAIIAVTGSNDLVLGPLGFPDNVIFVAAITTLSHSQAYAFSPEYREALEDAGAIIVNGYNDVLSWTEGQVALISTPNELVAPPYFAADPNGGNLKATKGEAIAFHFNYEFWNGGCKYSGDVKFNKLQIPFDDMYTDEPCNASDAYDYVENWLEYALNRISEMTHDTLAVNVIRGVGNLILSWLQRQF